MEVSSTSGEQAEGVRLDELAATLVAHGFALCPDFLSHRELRALALDCQGEWLSGALAPAHVGRGASRELRRDIRGDSIRWLEKGEPSMARREVLARLERLRVAMNRRAFLGLFDLECHYAVYPVGARYERHLDTFRDVSHRVVSWVLYLNEDWSEEDGGELRVYVPSNGAPAPHSYFNVPAIGDAYFDVPPVGGSLVTFLSAEFEHEVLPARRERASLTGWFRTRP